MAPREVECERCGSVAVIKNVEGDLDLGKHKSTIILIIACPKCGEREQLEKAQSQSAAR
jgi:DNA-directed RNA polymerase subunit RPC12/RpoP